MDGILKKSKRTPSKALRLVFTMFGTTQVYRLYSHTALHQLTVGEFIEAGSVCGGISFPKGPTCSQKGHDEGKKDMTRLQKDAAPCMPWMPCHGSERV